eukprot:790984-Pleurochrysis_carterae.AAC.2
MWAKYSAVHCRWATTMKRPVKFRHILASQHRDTTRLRLQYLAISRLGGKHTLRYTVSGKFRRWITTAPEPNAVMNQPKPVPRRASITGCQHFQFATAPAIESPPQPLTPPLNRHAAAAALPSDSAAHVAWRLVRYV